MSQNEVIITWTHSNKDNENARIGRNPSVGRFDRIGAVGSHDRTHCRHRRKYPKAKRNFRHSKAADRDRERLEVLPDSRRERASGEIVDPGILAQVK